ncbi:tetratricopeptide repeat protein [Flavobacteriaceae bacterium MAR_2010_72]|nr:tetratricopeptide repeat protein [Flavobacteriaceae bacterium MAR_2010_72]TVZ58503.1 tetratricopeptide repeat protein [Flavobacteriaceae bacterium MAR_2010_105]
MIKSTSYCAFLGSIKNFLLIIFLFSISFAISQSTEQTFENKLDLVRVSKPKNYSTIDSIFRNFKNDSLKMKVLIEKTNAYNYTEGEIYARNALGIIYRNLSLYNKAIETHQSALTIAETSDNIEQSVISLNMLGVVYRRMDLIKPAIDYHKKAYDIASTVKDPNDQLKLSIAVSENGMGNLYLTLKQYELALEQFKKSLQIEKEAGNRLGLAINYQNIGYANEALGDLDNALVNYKLSLSFNEQINSNVGKAICYNSIGQVYIKQKKYDDAKTIIEKGLEKALSMNDQFYITLSYINLGWVQNEMGLDAKSEENLKKALVIADEYNLKTSVIDAHMHLSVLYTKQGNYKMALNHYKNYIELDKTINNERNLQYVSDIIIQYEHEAKNNQIKALSSENELVRSKLERNQKIFWFTLLGLIVATIIILIYNRTKHLHQEKQILTLEKDVLRSQMNPHFIFNSLNSIKLYIINNEKENAVYYLNKFSKLIRKILISSTEKEISLDDELETMKLYMNIENIRFSNEIDFKITVDDHINTSSIKVPSLILQPFLENALWHGLSSKKEDKKVQLQVSKPSEDFITIEITDNGIGRKSAELINKNKILKRKSVGISITKARLTNFSKGYTRDYKIKIEDLYNDQKEPTGTKVIVHIPIRSTVLKTA